MNLYNVIYFFHIGTNFTIPILSHREYYYPYLHIRTLRCRHVEIITKHHTRAWPPKYLFHNFTPSCYISLSSYVSCVHILYCVNVCGTDHFLIYGNVVIGYNLMINLSCCIFLGYVVLWIYDYLG